jgi:hypothetical protein
MGPGASTISLKSNLDPRSDEISFGSKALLAPNKPLSRNFRSKNGIERLAIANSSRFQKTNSDDHSRSVPRRAVIFMRVSRAGHLNYLPSRSFQAQITRAYN